MDQAFKLALGYAEKIENFSLNRCPFDDGDVISAHAYALQNLIHPFLAAINRINDPILSAYIKDVYPNPQSFTDMVETLAILQSIIDYLRELSQKLEDNNNIMNISLRECSPENIYQEWEKLLRRKKDDPEGLLTLAKSMIESTCKYILDCKNVEYTKNTKLPALYKNVSDALNMHVTQHEDQRIKNILGACTTIVNNLCELRNDYGDGHGIGKKSKKMKVSYRHSEFIANIVGAMSIFLLKTNKDKEEK
jgi:hypothetical protein